MKALVLAAGKGSRLGSAGGGVPKPLTQIGDTTPLELNLAQVAALGVAHIWINLHEQADTIRDHIGDDVNGVAVSYSFEPTLLGTAGAWKNLADEWQDTTLIVYGDNFMKFDMAALLATHRQRATLATIAVFDPARHAHTGIAGGRVQLEGGRVTDFTEGGATGFVNAGAYCMEPAVLQRIAPGFSDFGRDVLPGLARDGLLAAHVMEADAFCLGVDTPEGLQVARELVRSVVPGVTSNRSVPAASA